MKKILITSLFLLSMLQLSAQELAGAFKEGNDSISFAGNKVIFSLSDFSGLSNIKTGEGEFEQTGRYLLVHTNTYSGEKSSFEPSDATLKDSTVIKVVSNNHYVLPGILVELLNKSHKTIAGKVSDENGIVYVEKDPKIVHIKISALGYDEIEFPYNPQQDYLVSVVKKDIIENQTVAFKIDKPDEETLSILLLSDEFEAKNNLEKALEKLDKRAAKNNQLPKQLKKVYIPIYYR
ncbi:hypothetical protein [Limibacterium fermenti]|uniref:hypothetical protein n=1 Tax=Limibacterium fermenti TaxID=3229863 RepID=UPI0026D33AD0